MKRYPFYFIILVALPFILGMSSFNGVSSPSKIPMTQKKYIVTFTDQMDVSTECRDASIDGLTLIEGQIGNGIHAINFDKIRHIVFHLRNENLFADITFIDGNFIELKVKKSAKAFGVTKYGTFEIRLIDLKKIIVEGSVK
ncbi:MAG: hypothetical protein JW925_13605 [Syntrophaceae bacterium]|nr:hypothetical protein [Syntrophaceae bacterium]